MNLTGLLSDALSPGKFIFHIYLTLIVATIREGAQAQLESISRENFVRNIHSTTLTM